MITVPATRDILNPYIAGRKRRILDVTDFGAKGNGTRDDTGAYAACISLIEALGAGSIYSPFGNYKTTRQLVVDGQKASITFFGDSGIRTTVSGGLYNNSTSMIEYDGPGDEAILLFDSGQGSSVEKMTLSTKSSGQYVIDIDGVEGIKFINKAICRNHNISLCGFYRLSRGLHYYDDGSNASSNLNMDGQWVDKSSFDTCVVPVLIDQTNVYDMTIDRCQFFGTGNNMKHAVHIKKGHAYLTNSHISKLKPAESEGGADGIACYIENGCLDMANVYTEGHNAPLYHWVSAEPSTMSARLDNVVSLNQSITIPTPWNIRNSTNQDLIITGGYSQRVQADVGSTGKILAYGCSPANLYNSIDALNDPSRILRWNASGDLAGNIRGAGTPEGVVTASVGKIYTRTDGGVGTTLYVKETGTGNTGWAAK